MNKQQQIEEMASDMDYSCTKRDLYPDDAKEIAKVLYLLGYRKASGSEAELQELNIKYYNEAKDLRRQLADIEAENKRLSEKLGQILLNIDTVKEFAEKIKNEVYPFLQAKMFDEKHFITGHLESDKLLENQNIGIIKAQAVLSRWFKVKIDELLKEYEQ